MAAAYDPRGDRMVLFGGWSGTDMLGDTQFLTWNDEGAAATATSDVSTVSGAAELEWDTQNTVSAIGAVYRRQTGTEWTSIGTFEADVTGHVEFTDNSITPGQEYGYQIIVSSEAGDELVGEVWTSPTTGIGDTPKASIALQVWPNPAVGSFAASFSLVNNAPAQLDMFDVRGARVFSREINGLGAGAHRVDVGTATDYASGVYFMRLTQSGHSVTSRFVVVR